MVMTPKKSVKLTHRVARLPKDTQHFQNNKRTPSSTEAREPEESRFTPHRVPLLTKDMQHFQNRNRETTVCLC